MFSGVTGEHLDRVWNLSELAVLHELQTPIAVIVYGLFENPRRCVCVSLKYLVLAMHSFSPFKLDLTWPSDSFKTA